MVRGIQVSDHDGGRDIGIQLEFYGLSIPPPKNNIGKRDVTFRLPLYPFGDMVCGVLRYICIW